MTVIGAAAEVSNSLNPTSSNNAAAAITTGTAGAGQTAIAGISQSEFQKYVESKKETKETTKSEPKNMAEVIQQQLDKQEAEEAESESQSPSPSSGTIPAKYSNTTPEDRIITPAGGIAPASSLENIIQVETSGKTTSGEEVIITAPLSKFNQSVKDQILTPDLVKDYNAAQIKAANKNEPVPLDTSYNPYSHGTTREIPLIERPGVQETIYKVYDETGKKVNIPQTPEQIFQEEQYNKAIEGMGLSNVDTFVNTYVKDPVGRFDPAFPNTGVKITQPDLDVTTPGERIDQWKTYEGEEATANRAISSAKAPVELGLSFLPSFGEGVIGGAVIRAGGAVIGKLASSGKVGATIANILTKPLITGTTAKTAVTAVDITADKSISSALIKTGTKFAVDHPTITLGLETASKAVTTPSNAALNAIAVSYGVDIASRVNAEPTVSGKISTAARIAFVELPALVIGGKIGYSAVTKGIGRYETRGLTALKPTDYGYEIGIPNVYHPTITALKTSFAESTYSPKPYKFSNTENPFIRQPNPVNARLPENPSGVTAGLTQYTHTTPYGDAFKKPTVTVQKGSSEAPGMYVAPAFNFYYAKTANEMPRPRLFMTGTLQTSNPATVTVYGNAPKAIPYDKLGLPQNKAGANAFMSENAKQGEVYLPKIKEEMEGIITVGTELKQLPTRYYFELNGVRVPAREFKISSAKNQPHLTAISKITTGRDSGSSKYNAKYQYPSITAPGSRPAFTSKPAASSEKSGSSKGISGTSPIGSISLPSSSGKSLISQGKSGSSKGISGTSPIGSISLPSSSGKSLISQGKSGSSKGISGISPISSKKPNFPSGSSRQTPVPKNLYNKPDKTDEKRKRDSYARIRRETITHLSILDPLEYVGKGSITNRKQPERVIYTKPIYQYNGSLSLRKPKGASKRKGII
jgi:hypothetical protein